MEPAEGSRTETECSKHIRERLQRYLTAPDSKLDEWEREGFTPSTIRAWAEGKKVSETYIKRALGEVDRLKRKYAPQPPPPFPSSESYPIAPEALGPYLPGKQSSAAQTQPGLPEAPPARKIVQPADVAALPNEAFVDEAAAFISVDDALPGMSLGTLEASLRSTPPSASVAELNPAASDTTSKISGNQGIDTVVDDATTALPPVVQLAQQAIVETPSQGEPEELVPSDPPSSLANGVPTLDDATVPTNTVGSSNQPAYQGIIFVNHPNPRRRQRSLLDQIADWFRFWW